MTDRTLPQPFTRQLLENHEVQFWILQFIGWSGWAVSGIIAWMYFKADPLYYFVFPLAAVVAVILSTGLRYVYRLIWPRAIIVRSVVVIIASYVAALVWQLSKNWLVFTILPDMVEGGDSMWSFNGARASFYIMLCWSGLYFGIKYYKMSQEQTQLLLKITGEAHQAQLKMLRYQLNPHFLFNTLNAISTLILERQTDLANTMVARLSSFLRHSLDSDPMEKVPLEDEIAALKLYLDIEQVRFDERLRTDIDLDDSSRQALIPSLLLQPLVENSIKYAIATSESGGTISIQARVFAGELLLELSDDGPGISDAEQVQLLAGNGVGLRNTRERLHSAYNESTSFRLAKAEPHGLKVLMRMPYETR